MNTERLSDAWAIRWTRRNLGMYLMLTLLLGLAVALPLVAFILLAGRGEWIGPILLAEAGVLVLVFGLTGVVYAAVGSRVRKVRESLAAVPADLRTDCLMVNGIFQAPGIAVLNGRTLRLVPAAGKPVEVDLDTVTVEEKSGRFNGASYPGKIHFWFKGPRLPWRLAFMPEQQHAWHNHLIPNPSPTTSS